MQVIPAIDLKNGVIVRGIGGRRDQYRPIESMLCQDAAPLSVGAALVQRFGFGEAYLADLDAIAGAEPAWAVYEALAGIGLGLWIDAGVRSTEQIHQLVGFTASHPLARIVIGLETLPDPALLSDAVQLIGPERCVFSLDLKQGQPLTTIAAWRGLAPSQIVTWAVETGIRGIIILDLADVGGNRGTSTAALCTSIRAGRPHVQLIAGGGVRCLDDLMALCNAGCSGALVASALHDGHLTAADLATIRSDS